MFFADSYHLTKTHFMIDIFEHYIVFPSQNVRSFTLWFIFRVVIALHVEKNLKSVGEGPLYNS